MTASELYLREFDRALLIQVAKPLRLEPSPLPTVTPMAVYAVGRDCFDCIVRDHPTSLEALGAIFTDLPMRENGWNADNTSIHKIGIAPGGYIWRVRRKASPTTVPSYIEC